LLSVYFGDRLKNYSVEAASRPVKRHIWRHPESVNSLFADLWQFPTKPIFPTPYAVQSAFSAFAGAGKAHGGRPCGP
jgi:hypothetical protein